MEKFTCKKFVTYEHGKIRREEWAITGAGGTISVWRSPRFSNPDEYIGGVETHELVTEDEADFKCCHIGGHPCRHDGTSCWFDEYWAPFILPLGDDAIFSRLREEHENRFACCEEKEGE